MSGFEIAGVVLAAVSIIISVVEIWQGTHKRTRKWLYVDQLTRALLLQQQTVTEIVRLLTVHSGFVNHDVVSQSQLDDDPIGFFRDKHTQDQLLDFLGEANHEALTGALREITDTLRRVASQILGPVPAHQDRPDDLLWIIEAIQAGNFHRVDFVGRIRLVLRSSEIKRSIKDLDAATNSLNRFSQLVLMNHSVAPIADSSRKTVRLARALRRIRVFANDLYAALCRCCRRGTCHSDHEVNIFLEDRVDAADDILRPSRRQDKNMASVVVFQLILTGNHLTLTQKWWHELPIQVLHRDECDATAALASTPTPIRLISPADVTSKNLTRVPIEAGLVPIDDFCAAIAAAKNRAQPVAFLLSGTGLISKTITEEMTIIQQDNAKKVTLRTILSGCESIPYGIGFSLRLRMLLALRLASNLIQLSQTRGMRSSVDFSRAFVSAAIDDQEEATGSCNIQPKVVLLELGILLLEIWHQTTLEAHFNLDKAPTLYYPRLARALEWLDDGENPPPCLYESAISHCLRGMPDIARLTSWDTNELWDVVCREIIEPLWKNCKQWR